MMLLNHWGSLLYTNDINDHLGTMVTISPCPWRVLVFFGISMDSVDFISAPKEPATSQSCQLGSPFLKCVVSIALDPPPSLRQTSKCGKKVIQTILTSHYIPPPLLSGNAHMETTHFKKGLPLAANEDF